MNEYDAISVALLGICRRHKKTDVQTSRTQ